MRHAGVINLSWSDLKSLLRLPANVHLDGVSYEPRSNTVGLIIEGHTALPQVPDGELAPNVPLDIFDPEPVLDWLP